MASTCHITLDLDDPPGASVLAAVAKFVNELEDGVHARAELADGSSVDDSPDLLPWDQESAEALVREAAEADDDGRTLELLNHLAQRHVAGKTVSSREVARALGIPTPSLAGVLGPLNKRAKNEYGRVAPIKRMIRRVSKDGKRISRSFLTMDEAFAAMVRQAATEVRP